MTQFEVWYQDRRSRKLTCIYVLAESIKDAIRGVNKKDKPVDCRRRFK